MKILEDFFDENDLDKKIWRYISIDKLDSMLKTNSLYFASAEQFNDNDNFEGSITEKEYQKRDDQIRRIESDLSAINRQLEHIESAFKRLREYTKISCWHLNNYENISMWRYYLRQDKGVAIQSTLRKLLENIGIPKSEVIYGEEIYIGRINYIDYNIDSMNKKYGFITPFLYKRKEFEDENEIRFIISLRLAAEFGVEIPKQGIEVPFNFESGIEKIVLHPNADKELNDKVNQIISDYQKNITVKSSSLTIPAKY